MAAVTICSDFGAQKKKSAPHAPNSSTNPVSFLEITAQADIYIISWLLFKVIITLNNQLIIISWLLLLSDFFHMYSYIMEKCDLFVIFEKDLRKTR